MTSAHHPIQLVARLTGLSAHVIRIWEQRYNAVSPQRTHSKRRLYSRADIERLICLRDLTRAGHSIGQVSRLTTPELKELASATFAGKPPSPALTVAEPDAEGLILDQCLAAIARFDPAALTDAFQRGATALGTMGFLQRVAAPVAQRIGELWRGGELTAAHEHFATSVLRGFLAGISKPFGGLESAPTLLVATPAGQVHELGALMVAALASNLGWQVTYLGASLPALEIAGAAKSSKARAVALSVVYPEDDPGTESELISLRRALPPETPLLVGGRALSAYRSALVKTDCIPVESLDHLGSILDGLRKSGLKAA